MSQTNQPDHYRAFTLTKKGKDLRQRAIAGDKDGNKFIIEFTRGAIGQGQPDTDTDPFYMTELVDLAIDVPVKESYAEDINHIMTIVISNTDLKTEILMSEIGIFARLLNADTKEEVVPEALYGYTYTDKYDYIPVATTCIVYREITFNTILSREGTFEIVFDGSKVFLTVKDFQEYLESFKSSKGASETGYDNSVSGLTAENVQNALDEIVAACKRRIIVSDDQPKEQAVGDFWYDTSGSQPDPSGVVMLNVVVSDIEPESKFVWFDTGAGI